MSTDEAPLGTAIDLERTALGEDTMVGRERWEEIRRVGNAERLSVSELARRFDLDRKTVRRCLRQETWQPYQRPARTDTLLAEHATFLETRASAVQYSARILYQELRQQRGGTSRLLSAVALVVLAVRVADRTDHGGDEVVLTFELRPGDVAHPA